MNLEIRGLFSPLFLYLLLDDYINVVKIMEQWAALSNDAKQMIFICLIAMMFGAWVMMKTMNKLDRIERRRKEALKYEEENFTIE